MKVHLCTDLNGSVRRAVTWRRRSAFKFLGRMTAITIGAAALWLGLAACNGNADASKQLTSKRKSDLGESCKATDDCAAPGRCIDAVCRPPSVSPVMSTVASPVSAPDPPVVRTVPASVTKYRAYFSELGTTAAKLAALAKPGASDIGNDLDALMDEIGRGGGRPDEFEIRRRIDDLKQKLFKYELSEQRNMLELISKLSAETDSPEIAELAKFVTGCVGIMTKHARLFDHPEQQSKKFEVTLYFLMQGHAAKEALGLEGEADQRAYYASYMRSNHTPTRWGWEKMANDLESRLVFAGNKKARLISRPVMNLLEAKVWDKNGLTLEEYRSEFWIVVDCLLRQLGEY